MCSPVILWPLWVSVGNNVVQNESFAELPSSIFFFLALVVYMLMCVCVCVLLQLEYKNTNSTSKVMNFWGKLGHFGLRCVCYVHLL